MIVLDTHIWVWWVHGDERLTDPQVAWLQQYESQGHCPPVSCGAVLTAWRPSYPRKPPYKG